MTPSNDTVKGHRQTIFRIRTHCDNSYEYQQSLESSGGDERKPLAHGRRASASSEDLCALTEK